MKILFIALKDLRQILGDRKSAVFLLLLPILFTAVFGLLFSQNGKDARLPIGWINPNPTNPLSAHLRTLLERSTAVRLVDLPTDAAVDEQIQQSTLAAAVILPADFGETAPLTLIVDETTPAGQTAARALSLAATRLWGALEIARIADQTTTPAPAAVDRAVAAWQEPRVAIEINTTGAPLRETGFARASTGMLVLFAIFGLTLPGSLLLTERQSGTLSRQLTTPLHRAEIIAGHILAIFLLNSAQIALLALLGQLALGINYGQSLPATLLIIAALALWISSFGLFIGSVSRNENQVILITMGSLLILGLMGGAIFPLELTGRTFAALGHLLPTAWAIEGLQNIVLRGAGIQSVLLPAGILGLYALGFFGLGVWKFN